jgi:Inner membrane protein YgaP-like, transmembrane domain
MARKYFPKNMGTLDRAFRAFVVAPVALVAALVVGFSTVAGLALLVVVAVAVATGATGVCPSYVPLGIDTHGPRAAAPSAKEA